MQMDVHAVGFNSSLEPLASCCGHNRYPKTIVVRFRADKGFVFEYFSGVIIPRKRRFYKRDKEGYYFIPEVIRHMAKQSRSLESEGTW